MSSCNIKKILYIFILLITFLIIDGCMGHTDPVAIIALQSANYLNPDINGKTAPIVVSLYELKSPFEFRRASFDELDLNPSLTLGQNLIDMQSIELRPGTTELLSQYLTTDTHYIGIVAAYRNLDKTNWKQVIEIPENKNKFKLTLSLQSQGVVYKLN